MMSNPIGRCHSPKFCTFQSDVEGLKRQKVNNCRVCWTNLKAYYEYNGSIPRTFRRRSKILAVYVWKLNKHPRILYKCIISDLQRMILCEKHTSW
jgi:hypothetical protein